jgi:hypothetical protein
VLLDGHAVADAGRPVAPDRFASIVRAVVYRRLRLKACLSEATIDRAKRTAVA